MARAAATGSHVSVAEGIASDMPLQPAPEQSVCKLTSQQKDLRALVPLETGGLGKKVKTDCSRSDLVCVKVSYHIKINVSSLLWPSEV